MNKKARVVFLRRRNNHNSAMVCKVLTPCKGLQSEFGMKPTGCGNFFPVLYVLPELGSKLRF